MQQQKKEEQTTTITDDTQSTHISKFLSYILRHHPETIGVTMDEHGRININELRTCANTNGIDLSHDTILHTVAHDDKQRFCISDDGESIRANHGHSIDIDLQLAPRIPPAILYHGTTVTALESIMQQGLTPQHRNYVHLSTDTETARIVGARHGDVIVLQIDTAHMHTDGHTFYYAASTIWLTDYVSPHYIQILHTP